LTIVLRFPVPEVVKYLHLPFHFGRSLQPGHEVVDV
jgi:hypothetical protein